MFPVDLRQELNQQNATAFKKLANISKPELKAIATKIQENGGDATVSAVLRDKKHQMMLSVDGGKASSDAFKRIADARRYQESLQVGGSYR